MKTALVFGASGQAGMFLVPLLKEKGYKVIAPAHNVVDVNKIELMQCICSTKPDELYNLAAVLPSGRWDDSVTSMNTNTVAVRQMLSILFGVRPDAKFFQASSASIFGDSPAQQHELSEKCPTTTYGVSKLAAQEMVRLYRDNGFFACTGIFFNMESQYRHQSYFTRKVALGLAKIVKAIDRKRPPETLKFGNLNARRDWGLTSEYMEAAYLIMQAPKPDEYIVGTGVSATCLEFVNYAFDYLNVDHKWYTYKEAPLERGVDIMYANPAKIYKDLGWKAKTSYKGVIAHLLEISLDKEYVQSLIAR